MSKWVGVVVTVLRRFIVEVPDDAEDAQDYAEKEVYKNALSNKDQKNVTDIYTCLVINNEDIEQLKQETEVVKLV